MWGEIKCFIFYLYKERERCLNGRDYKFYNCLDHLTIIFSLEHNSLKLKSHFYSCHLNICNSLLWQTYLYLYFTFVTVTVTLLENNLSEYFFTSNHCHLKYFLQLWIFYHCHFAIKLLSLLVYSVIYPTSVLRSMCLCFHCRTLTGHHLHCLELLRNRLRQTSCHCHLEIVT